MPKKSKPQPVFYVIADHIDCRRVFHSVEEMSAWLEDMYGERTVIPYISLTIEDLQID